MAGSVSPLRSAFNEASNKPRFLALLSPTCGPCLRGATAVRDEVVEAFRTVGYPASVVWTPMLSGDSPAAIEEAAAEFDRDGIRQFADPERTVGRLVANSLGEPDDIAWDIYLFYGPEVRWTDQLPEPAEWVHQLGSRSWAPPERYRCGNELEEELGTVARRMISRDAATGSDSECS